ncbi:MAG: nitroreductase family protein [Thermoproteota archaeon]
MDVLEAIKGRRSIRAFRDQDVSDETVKKLIDAARWAPSSGNVQPWEFVIIREPDIKRRLAKAALSQMFIFRAPVVIVVCADERLSFQSYRDRGKNLYCIQDTSAATQNIHLAAYRLGLGTCWVGAFSEGEVSKILNIPERLRPVSIIPIGFPAEFPLPPDRKPVRRITHLEEF